MDIVIAPTPDPDVAEAARRAAEHAGIELQPHAGGGRGPWWRAGLADALERASGAVDAPVTYDAARSPRSTRGATRA